MPGRHRVQLLTATHPVDPDARRLGWEYGQPITIADSVWRGAGVIVFGDFDFRRSVACVRRDIPNFACTFRGHHDSRPPFDRGNDLAVGRRRTTIAWVPRQEREP